MCGGRPGVRVFVDFCFHVGLIERNARVGDGLYEYVLISGFLVGLFVRKSAGGGCAVRVHLDSVSMLDYQSVRRGWEGGC